MQNYERNSVYVLCDSNVSIALYINRNISLIMKLLRFNQSPVEFQDSDIISIEEENKILVRVNLKNESYLGYCLI